MMITPVLRKLFPFLPLLLAVSIFSGFTQEFHTARTSEYEVKSAISEDHAQDTAEALQALSQLYNDYFRFSTEELTSRLHVRVFEEQENFDEYLDPIIEETRDEFVYLHYTDAAQSELVGYDMEDSETYNSSLTHQSVIQFMRAFIPNPPLWLREGFAVYLERSRFDTDAGEAVFHENSAWIETLQGILSGESEHEPFALDEFLHLSPDAASQRLDVFYPQAWGVISFLLNSEDPEYDRILWDSLAALDPQSSLDRNSQRVADRVMRWVESEDLVQDFIDYTMALESFSSLVESGIEEYSAGRYDEAEEFMQSALERNDENHVPWYYLGLIHYSRGNYEAAAEHYERAGELGADEGLISYALGLNAFAADRPEEALELLNEAVEINPDRYEEDAQALIRRIEG